MAADSGRRDDIEANTDSNSFKTNTARDKRHRKAYCKAPRMSHVPNEKGIEAPASNIQARGCKLSCLRHREGQEYKVGHKFEKRRKRLENGKR